MSAAAGALVGVVLATAALAAGADRLVVLAFGLAFAISWAMVARGR